MRQNATRWAPLIAGAAIVSISIAAAADASSGTRSTASATQSSDIARTSDVAAIDDTDCMYSVTVAGGNASRELSAAMSTEATESIVHDGVELSIVDEQDRVSVGALWSAATYIVVEVDQTRRSDVIDAVTVAIDDPNVSFDDDADFTAEFQGVECDLGVALGEGIDPDDVFHGEASFDLTTDDGHCELSAEFTEEGFDWKDIHLGDIDLGVDEVDGTFTISLDTNGGVFDLGCSDD
ncbi:MAG: hypothetical protein ABJH68_12100 [Ilumatobacter sp.]|uniref:hypothetical protein n=1 Tax=Ilumatobacter sp. TaxID=1967498 RepID=UPI003297F054